MNSKNDNTPKSSQDQNYTSEEYLRQRLTQLMTQAGPDDAQTERVWKQILAAPTKKHAKAGRLAFAAAFALAICLGGAVGANAASDGALLESVIEFCGLSEHQKQVAEETLTLPNEVYASVLAACSDKYIISANERGLMVYDRTLKGIVAALDLQAIDCNYFNADTIETHVFLQNDTLYIFNRKKTGKNDGENVAYEKPTLAYTYNLSLAGEEDALEKIQNAARLTEIEKDWESYRQAHIRDTFDEIQGKTMDLNELSDNASYSEYCILWTDDSGIARTSFLVDTPQDRYMLYTRREDNGTLEIEELSLETAQPQTQTDEEGLPDFRYTGDDEVLRAACELTLKECASSYGLEEGGVMLPAPVILATVPDGDDLIVFCNLWIFGYYQNGNTLNCESGGEMPSRLRLTPDTDGSYKVTELLKAGDGSHYLEDIQMFCEGYPVSHEIYFDDEASCDSIRLELIQMYVEDNQLDIKYYKDYGWDPVDITR